jgi:transposase InsO family protein
MHKYILEQLHQGHQGILKTKLRAKDTVFWCNMNDQIEKVVGKCSTCQEYRRTQTKETLLPHEIPTRPWQTLGTDLFHFNGDNYLIVADYYTKFPVVRQMPSRCTSQSVVKALKQIFGEYGTPDVVISDNGPQYDCETFKVFSDAWQFSHITSSPHFPQSNGFVERQIQTVKRAFMKAKDSGTDMNAALLCIRTTPIDNQLPSPAELLYGRKIKGNVPVIPQNNLHNKDNIYERLQERQDKQKQYFDQHAKDLPPLQPGQAVRIQDHVTGKWTPAKVINKCPEPRSYTVKTDGGAILRRNRKHIQYVQDAKRENQDAKRENQDAKREKSVRFNLDTNPSVNQNVSRSTPAQNTPHTQSGRLVKKPEKLNL